MKRKLCTILVLCGLLASAQQTIAQDYIPIFTRDYSSRLSVEIDPITFVLKGHSFYVRYQPMFTDRFVIGIGTYAMDLSEAIVDMNGNNRDKGWDVRIKGAFLVSAEFYAKEANNGWFIGERIGFQSMRVRNNTEVRGSSTFNNLFLTTYVGYNWHPFKGSFFVKPWAGIGFREMVDGTSRVGGLNYDIGPLFPFFTVHLGYTF